MGDTVAWNPVELTLPSVFKITASTFVLLSYGLADEPICPERVASVVDDSQRRPLQSSTVS